MKLKYFVVILLSLLWITDVSATGNGLSPECCQRTSKGKVIIEKIESYVYQKPPCYLKAIRFLLKSGKTICSNPEDVWAKYVTQLLDYRTIASTSRPSKSTLTMIIPKGLLTTWKLTMVFNHGISTKQPLSFTEEKPQETSMQTIKMTTSTTTIDSSPSLRELKMTFRTMLTTTISPLITKAPVKTSTIWKPTSYIMHKVSDKELPRITTWQIRTTKEKMMFTSKETVITWKPTKYNSYSLGFTKEHPMNTMTTRQSLTTKQRMTYTTKNKTTSITRTTKYKDTWSHKGTLTTQKPVQKLSTAHLTRCPPFRKNKLDKYKIAVPWTVKRLKKKLKQGLRRMQMNTGCIEN